MKLVKILLMVFLLIISVSFVSATDSELFIVYDVGDDQCAVDYDWGWGIGSDELLIGQSSGGSSTSSPSIPDPLYVIGDGICEADLGETYIVSPVDCQPFVEDSFYEDNKSLIWLALLALLLIVYISYQKRRGVY